MRTHARASYIFLNEESEESVRTQEGEEEEEEVFSFLNFFLPVLIHQFFKKLSQRLRGTVIITGTV